MPFPPLLCFPLRSEILDKPSPPPENSLSALHAEARGVFCLHPSHSPTDSEISMPPTARGAKSADARGVETQIPASSPRVPILARLALLLLPFLAFCPFHAAIGETFTISWAANPESDLGGYTVHLGTSSGNYSSTYDAGNQTRFTLPPLAPATTYYCAVQAYNIYGLTGVPSTEVAFTTSAAIAPPAEITVDDDTGNTLIQGSASLGFGSVVVGGSGSSRSLIVTNTGGTILSGLGATLAGSNATDFFVSDPGVTSLAPGESMVVDILFDPMSVGARSASLTITSNDSDESSFVVALQGTGTTTPIADVSLFRSDGSEVTSNGVGASFGTVLLGSASTSQIFTIRNVGSAPLTSLAVSLSGANPSDFTVSGLSAGSLAAGASGTFSVTFRPAAAGSRTAFLQLASSDPDENPFIVPLSGTGSAVPEIGISKADGTELADAAASLAFGAVNLGASGATQTITVRNSGIATLSGIAASIDGAAAADFAVSSFSSSSLAAGGSLSLTITFKPTAAGTRTATLRIASNDADENPFDIIVGGTGVAIPEITVSTADGTALTNGSSSLDLGAIHLGGSSAPRTIQIANTGTAALTGLGATLTGAGAADFVISTNPGSSVAAGGAASISVIFQPKSSGLRTALLRIASNDADENPFDITLIGTGVAIPQIEVFDGNGASITSGNPWSMGTVDLGKSTGPREIVILSAGTANLTGLGASLTGAHASDFTLQGSSTTTLVPGDSTSLFLTFKPTAAGIRTATLTITSNSRAGSSFVIPLSGTAAAHPKIEVLDPTGSSLTDGTAPLAFPTTELGESSAAVVCTVSNSGTADLTDFALVATGPHASDFTISPLSSSVLKAGQTATFSVTFAPGGTGSRNATLAIQSNDENRGLISIPLSGKGFGIPELDVLLDGQSLAPARVSPIDFGAANTGDSGMVKTFTIRNTGSATLAGLKVSRNGPSAADFVISGPETTSLKPGAAITFKVRFNPSDKGPREAMLTVSGDDAVTSAVRIPVVGTSVPVSKMELKVAGGSVLTKNRAYIALSDHSSKSLVITNRGNAALANLKLVASGIHVDDFEIARLKATTLAPGRSATVKIRFDSGGKGNRWGSLTVHSNDPKTPSFEISLVGKGPSTAKSAPARMAASIQNEKPSPRPVHSVVRIEGRKYRCITLSKSAFPHVTSDLVEVSSNLVDWNSGNRFTTVIEDNESHLKVRDNVPLAEGVKRHIRCRKSR